MISSPSPIEDLNTAIQNDNPFNRELVVRKQNVWGKEFPDVPSINAHASEAVFDAIEQVRTGQRQTLGITIRAEKGLGKTHLLSRIRHRLKEKGGALFVYMTEYGNDLDRIRLEFLKHLSLSLKNQGSQNVMQWQELATALVNEAEEQNDTPIELIDEFSQKLATDSSFVEELTDKILDLKPEIDNPYLVQAILWTLSKKHKIHAINWLQGKSLTQSKAEEMQLPNSSEEEREAESFELICQILDLISHYNPLVVCFDQLEGTEVNDGGFTKPQVIANLVMDLYNSMKRGVLLTAIFPETWTYQIRSLSYAESVMDRVGETILDLKYLNADDVVALVKRYLNNFYEQKSLIPITPVYPFEESKLKEIGQEKTTARRVLQWCKSHWKVPDIEAPTVEISPKDPVESAFGNELDNLVQEEFMEDASQLAKSIIFGLRTLIGQTIAGITIENIEAPITPKNKYLDLKIIGRENSSPVKIGVAILQESGGTGVTAGLSHLGDYQKYDLTCGCLVRSKKVSPSAKKAREHLNHLLTEQGGKWVVLKPQQVQPLLAIFSVIEIRDDYELSEEQIRDYIARKNLTCENPLLLAILQAPSGHVPEDAIDEEAT